MVQLETLRCNSNKLIKKTLPTPQVFLHCPGIEGLEWFLAKKALPLLILRQSKMLKIID